MYKKKEKQSFNDVTDEEFWACKRERLNLSFTLKKTSWGEMKWSPAVFYSSTHYVHTYIFVQMRLKAKNNWILLVTKDVLLLIWRASSIQRTASVQYELQSWAKLDT